MNELIECGNCGLDFDPSDLSQVFAHEHQIQDILTEKYKSMKVINHASEVYPTASKQFCVGVHNYLSGDYDLRNLHQESDEFRSGYYQAESDDLIDKVKMASKLKK